MWGSYVSEEYENENTWMYRSFDFYCRVVKPLTSHVSLSCHLILSIISKMIVMSVIVHCLFSKVCGSITILPLCDMPTLRHFWKRQYWHLLRDFLWMRQWRSQWSYTNFNLIVRLKKPYEKERDTITSDIVTKDIPLYFNVTIFFEKIGEKIGLMDYFVGK